MVSKRNSDGTLSPPYPYVMRGVCWSPASTDTDVSISMSNAIDINTRRLEFSKWYKVDIPKMREMNVNTVRVQIDLGYEQEFEAMKILDELYCNDIMVIMTVDDNVNDTMRIRQAVEFFKYHPAILMWMIGNTWNYNRYYGNASTVLEAAERTELAAGLIKSIDTEHPVATSYGEIVGTTPDLFFTNTVDYVNNICPSVDAWGLHIYRGKSFSMRPSLWKSFSSKPMFVSEFGTDAFRTDSISSSCMAISGEVDEVMQAERVMELWNELFLSFSAFDGSDAVIGGTAFAWNDEWWRAYLPDKQDIRGFCSWGHPDGFYNTEYSGVVDIERNLRVVFDSLRWAFHPDFQPLSKIQNLRIESAGCCVPPGGCTWNNVDFFKDESRFFSRGRGIDVAAIDTITGELLNLPKRFDTWATAGSGTEMYALINYLDSLEDGTLIMIGVGDEAGISSVPDSLFCLPTDCTLYTFPWVIDFINLMENMGSTMISNYCWRGSWSMITVKGTGVALAEDLKIGEKAICEIDIETSPPIYPIRIPLAPVLLHPLNDTVITTVEPLFSWLERDGLNSYHFQIAQDSLFTNIIDDISNITLNEVSSSSLNFGELYYWRVRAVNDSGESRWSCIQKFTTNFSAPNALCQDVTLSLDENGELFLSASDIDNGSNDSDGIESIEVVPNSFDCTNEGINQVELFVTDNLGLTSSCISMVTIIAPQIDTFLIEEIVCDSIMTGVDTVEVYNQLGCDSIIYFNQFIFSEITLDSVHVGNNSVNDEGFIDLFLSGGSPPYEFLWNTGDTSQNLSGLPNGVYEVLITDLGGCEITLSFDILTTGTGEISKAIEFDFSIFPNPSFNQEELFIEIGNSKSSILRIDFFDSLGSFLYNNYLEINGNNLVFSIPQPKSSGVYFVRIVDEKGNSQCGKFIINN